MSKLENDLARADARQELSRAAEAAVDSVLTSAKQAVAKVMRADPPKDVQADQVEAISSATQEVLAASDGFDHRAKAELSAVFPEEEVEAIFEEIVAAAA